MAVRSMGGGPPPSGGEVTRNLGADFTKVFVGNLPYECTADDLGVYLAPAGQIVHVELMTEGGSLRGRSKGLAIVEFETCGAASRAVQCFHDSVLQGRPILVREYVDNGYGTGPGGGGKRAVERAAAEVARRAEEERLAHEVTGEAVHGVEEERLAHVVAGEAGHGVEEERWACNPATASPWSAHRRPRPGAERRVCRVHVGNLALGCTWQALKDHFRVVGEVVRADVLRESRGVSGRSMGYGIVEFAHPEEARRAIGEMTNSKIHGRTISVREDREATRATAKEAAMAGPGVEGRPGAEAVLLGAPAPVLRWYRRRFDMGTPALWRRRYGVGVTDAQLASPRAVWSAAWRRFGPHLGARDVDRWVYSVAVTTAGILPARHWRGFPAFPSAMRLRPSCLGEDAFELWCTVVGIEALCGSTL